MSLDQILTNGRISCELSMYAGWLLCLLVDNFLPLSLFLSHAYSLVFSSFFIPCMVALNPVFTVLQKCQVSIGFQSFLRPVHDIFFGLSPLIISPCNWMPFTTHFYPGMHVPEKRRKEPHNNPSSKWGEKRQCAPPVCSIVTLGAASVRWSRELTTGCGATRISPSHHIDSL